MFLDEFPEFRRNILDLLRQPLENGEVTIARAAVTLTFPARFMLVAAMNPCPCGYSGDPVRPCSCGPHQVQHYRGRISGPILDRIDLHIEVPAVRYEDLHSTAPAESSASIRDRIMTARERQLTRYSRDAIYCNAHMKLWAPEKVLPTGRLRTEVPGGGLAAAWIERQMNRHHNCIVRRNSL